MLHWRRTVAVGRGLKSDSRGQALVEHVLLIAVVALVVISGALLFRRSVGDVGTGVEQALHSPEASDGTTYSPTAGSGYDYRYVPPADTLRRD